MISTFRFRALHCARHQNVELFLRFNVLIWLRFIAQRIRTLNCPPQHCNCESAALQRGKGIRTLNFWALQRSDLAALHCGKNQHVEFPPQFCTGESAALQCGKGSGLVDISSTSLQRFVANKTRTSSSTPQFGNCVCEKRLVTASPPKI